MSRAIAKKNNRVRSYPVAAAVSIADGDNVMIVGGYARTCSDLAHTGATGKARGAVDNSAGAAGDKRVLVEEGTFRLTGAGFAQTDVGTTAYASGAQTCAPTQTGANFPALGPVAEFYSATEVDVEMSLVAGRLTVN